MLKVVHDASVPHDNTESSGSSLLDEIVRDGARRMLAAALQAEVSAYIDAHADDLDSDGHRLVVRNGSHQPREVMTAAGVVPVRAPRVNDKRVDAETGERKRFSSAILPAWSRKSPRVAEVYNLGGGKGNACSILEAFRLAENVTGQPMKWRYVDENRVGDHICYYSDLTKMRTHYPNWNISKPLEVIFREIAGSWMERLPQKAVR